jgi:bifunctional non-homologous end joining protein LigD
MHEIKHDGYRLIVRRDGSAVRLFTRRGYEWSDRYPAIARAAAKLRARSFTIDGEAAVCGPRRQPEHGIWFAKPLPCSRRNSL